MGESDTGEQPKGTPDLPEKLVDLSKTESTFQGELTRTYGEDSNPRVELRSDEADSAKSVVSKRIEKLEAESKHHQRYVLKGEVGRGGMGAVLRIFDSDLRRNLAMKIVLGSSDKSSGSTSEIKANQVLRFIEEAQVTGQLDHPGVVPVHELGVDAEGRVYFTMQLVKGQDLSKVFKKVHENDPEWNQTRVLGVLLKVCEAMSYAHEKGVVHRDLKPANVMVGKHGAVYVMDWGLARVEGREDAHDVRLKEQPEPFSEFRTDRRDARQQDDDSPLMTMDGAILGTPFYMPPEQAAGRLDEIGPQADVYALGAMLYHLLTGRMPYHTPGDRTTALMIVARLLHGPPKPAYELAPSVAPELLAICEKAMARELPDRYPNMGELAEDLRAYMEQRVVHAYRTGAAIEFKKWVLRNKALAATAAAAVLLAISGVGTVAYVQAAGKAAALVQQGIAEANERRAEAETAKVLRLSDVKVLQELKAEADEIWPVNPEKLAALRSWLERANALLSDQPGHQATLTEMRSRANPWSDEEIAHDRTTYPRAAELAEKQAELSGLIAQLEKGLTGEALDGADARVNELELEVAALRSGVQSRRSWSFDSSQEEWQHDVLAELVGNLSTLEAGLLAEDAITLDHGWSIPKRLTLAKELEAGFAADGEFAQRWDEALPAIREAYSGLDLRPQMGLVPIGADAESALWEFWHVQSGSEPPRSEDGRLVVGEDSGLVFVLLPGGKFWMGAQSSDPNRRNFYKDAGSNEGPVHEVHLSAFFFSKYEMTQGQWQRLTGSNPSRYGPFMRVLDGHQHDLTHPVEQVSWFDCMVLLPRLGLVLPSEAQWEYGARGGKQTVWWTGDERESLKTLRAANIADQAAAREGIGWSEIADWPSFDDGFVAHAPATAFAANPFGLFNVHGNVWEWCLDGFDAKPYSVPTALDPVRTHVGTVARVSRGGSFDETASSARLARRGDDAPSSAENYLGLRPARVIEP